MRNVVMTLSKTPEKLVLIRRLVCNNFRIQPKGCLQNKETTTMLQFSSESIAKCSEGELF